MSRSPSILEARSDPSNVASRAGASATAGDLDRLSAFQRLLDDAREIARRTPAAAVVEILHDALSVAFATGDGVAWMRVYRALQIIEAGWVDHSATATATATAAARVRAFLAENADLADAGQLSGARSAGTQVSAPLTPQVRPILGTVPEIPASALGTARSDDRRLSG
jgi:hypothetical protein